MTNFPGAAPVNSHVLRSYAIDPLTYNTNAKLKYHAMKDYSLALSTFKT